jgi:hypothetical protein
MIRASLEEGSFSIGFDWAATAVMRRCETGLLTTGDQGSLQVRQNSVPELVFASRAVPEVL